MKKQLIITILCFGIVLCGGLFAQAATRTVDNISDSGSQTACTAAANDCSLRGAINNAASGDVIDFSPAIFSTTQTINLATRIILSDGKVLQVNGPGAGLLTITGTNNTEGLFYLFESEMTIRNLTLAGVSAISAYGVNVSTSAIGTVENCVVRNITALDPNVSSGALASTGTGLTIRNTELYNNSVAIASYGNSLIVSGVIVRNNTKLGILISNGTAAITNSVVKDNTGSLVHGIYINRTDGTIVSNSLFTGNSNTSDGSNGGALYLQIGNLIVENSTFSGNSASRGSAIGIESFGSASLTLTNSTVTGNNTPSGGAIENATNTQTVIRNTIIAGNTGNSRPDVYGNINSASYNLLGIVDDRFTGFIDANGNPVNNNLVGTQTAPLNPMLGPLANNGGATQTRALLPGSPAFNAGSNCVLTANGCGDNNRALTTDGRGAGFPRKVGASVDIGAYEMPIQGAFSFTPATLPIGSPNVSYSQQISVTGGNAPYTFMLDSGALPTGFSLSPDGLLSGTTAQEGAFNFAVRVFDNGNLSDVENYVLLIGRYVTNAAGSGAGSLRQLINDTPANGTIRFDPRFFNVPRAIAMGGAEFIVNKNLTIIGPGVSLLTLDGENTIRLFSVTGSGTTLNLSGARLTRGKSPTGGNGGAVFVGSGATFNAIDVQIDGSRADNNGGGIFNDGTLNLTRAVVNLNSSGSEGGGIRLQSGSTATITDSTVSNNTIDTASGGGIASFQATLNIERSTLSGNRAPNGGGIFTGGDLGTATTVNNSTLSGNVATAGVGGAIYILGNNTVNTTNTTVTNNKSKTNGTGGIYINGGLYNTRNTIVAGNCNQNDENNCNTTTGNPDVFGAIRSFGWNLIGSMSGNSFAANSPTLTGNLINVAANLAPLGNYGGATETHALLSNSPAIDAGDTNNSFTTDQRGAIRPAGGRGDIGAFERNITFDQTSLPNGFRNQAYSQTLTVARLASLTQSLAIQSFDLLTGFDLLNSSAAPFTFSIISIAGQSLPPGLTLTANGVISGTPTQTGTFTFTVKATDADGMAGARQFSITIVNAPPTISGATAASAAGSTGVNAQIATVGDPDGTAGSVSVTVTGANPSNGVTISNVINTNGTITADIATACNATNATFTLTATDGDGATATTTLTVNVTANTPPTLTYPAAVVTATGGSLNVAPTAAADNGTVSYSIQNVSPALTTAPTVNSSGVVSIVNPAPVGTYTITVRATDNCGATTDASFILTIIESWVVTKTADTSDGVCDADCSLREAIAAAASGQKISFSSLFDSPQVIALDAELLIKNKDLTITGPGRDLLKIDGQDSVRGFRIDNPASNTVNISKLSVTRGRAVRISSFLINYGGGIFLTKGTLNLTDAAVENCVTQRSGGSGIYSAGTLNLTNSVINNNRTIQDGSNLSSGLGAGIYSTGTLNLINSTVSNNNNQSGICAGICAFSTGSNPADYKDVSIVNSRITGNTNSERGVGAGMYISNVNKFTLSGSIVSGNTNFSTGSYNNLIHGGGIAISSTSSAQIENSTISGNSSDRGGGISTASNSANLRMSNVTISGNTAYNGGGIYNESNQIIMRNCTVAGNTAQLAGGGINQSPFHSVFSTTLANTIVADNASPDGADMKVTKGDVFVLGANIIETGISNSGTGTVSGAGTIINADPKLAPLSNYGGATQTQAIFAGSPAINAGVDAEALDTQPTPAALITDQRGADAPRKIGASVDIGAFENSISFDQTSLPDGATGTSYSQTLTAKRQPANSAVNTFSLVPANGQSLPDGLVLSASGVISGTPTDGGTFIFTVKAADADTIAGAAQFSITITGVAPPRITGATITRNVGSPMSNSQIATVTDNQGANTVGVTVTSANPSNGVSVSNIVNTNGAITADVAAACDATNTTFTLTATDDSGLTASSTLTVNVTANTPPTLVYPAQTFMTSGGSVNIAPSLAADNGTIISYSIQSFSPTFTTAPTVNSGGVVSIANAPQPGTYTITVRAADNCGATTDASMTIIVGTARTVTKLADTNDNVCDADCSLREAIFAAVSGDTIEFASPLFDTAQTIVLNGSELSISKNLTISGRDANLTAVSGNNLSRVFRVAAAGNLTLNNLTVSGGRTLISDVCGGGILNSGGVLTVNLSNIKNNTVTGATGSDVNRGSGICNTNSGNLTVRNSSISDNSSTGSNNFGVGIYNDATLTIESSTVSGNRGDGASGNNSGTGIFHSIGTLTVANSTVSGNSGNGSITSGSGIYAQSGTATITNSTITRNGCLINCGGTNFAGGLSIDGATVRVRNTIISGNIAPSSPDLGGTLALNDHNYIGGDARLAPLENYGGATPTHALLPDSPAINAGSNCVLNASCTNFTPPFALILDQRGIERIIGAFVDIGAFERNISFEPDSLPSGVYQVSYEQQLTAGRQTTLFESGYIEKNNSEKLVPMQFALVPVSGQQLPPGINLSTDGLLSGTPTTAGVFTFTVKATDVDSIAGVQEYTIQIYPLLAAAVSVSGKVLTPDGRGIANVLVTLTDLQGNSRTVVSNSFGYYRFDELSAGETYFLRGLSKSYQFTPQIVTASEDISGLNLIAEP